MPTNVFVPQSEVQAQNAYGEVYLSNGDDGDFNDGADYVMNIGEIGELDPNGLVIQDGSNAWLKIGPGGDGLYEVHFSVSAHSAFSPDFKIRLNVNSAQDCKIAARGGQAAAASSGLSRFAEGDVVALEIRTSDYMSIGNLHLWIRRIDL